MLEYDNVSKPYKKKNVGQCWRCKNMCGCATFKNIDENGEVEYIKLPECSLRHCYITEITTEKCEEYKRKR